MAQLAPGDRIKVRFGNRTVEGIVTRVRGDQIHANLLIEGADEPVPSLYRGDQLIDA
jgi:primosomal protein N'